jgi:hypothetical protein
MAFSTVATQDFFRAHPVPYYVLGFGYDEKSEFALKLLRKFRPPIKLLVINTDPFFEPGLLSPAVKDVELPVKAYLANLTKKVVALPAGILSQHGGVVHAAKNVPLPGRGQRDVEYP